MKQLTQKVLILFCAIMLLTEVKVLAQDSQGGKALSYGVRAGFSAPVLAVDNQPATYSRLAPVVGCFAQYRFLPWVAALVEVDYTQFGGNNIPPTFLYSPDSPMFADGKLQKTDLSIHSIEIPVLAKLGLPGMTGNVRPYLSIGGSAAFFLQANANNYFTESNGVNYPVLYQANNVVTSRIKSYDFACMSSTGVDFQGDKFNFSVEIYYRMGLTNLNTSTKTYAPDYRANAFGVKIGIGL